jgi:LDH2 family malate/lactate/ureidoglycolate dehydrogenase
VFGQDVVNFTKETKTATNTGQFVVAISIEAFGDLDQFKATVDTIFATMRDSTALPGTDSVRIPGQDRSGVLAERSKNGIPLHPNLVNVLAGIAGELNIPELKPRSDLEAD